MKWSALKFIENQGFHGTHVSAHYSWKKANIAGNIMPTKM